MKYRNKKTEVDGILFDSKKEANRFLVLKGMEESGEISHLERQIKFILIKGERWSDGKKHRDTVYVADFVYQKDGDMVVEDVKGFRTPVYKLKRELMKFMYSLEVKEV